MEKQKILNNYLFELEKSLMDIGPVDRSNIVVEIHEHIQEALQKYPEQSISEILNDLGHPQKVANHYRLNKGLKLFKPARHPILKWLSISFISMFAFSLLFIGVLVWKFTPVFELDEDKGKVILLGGLIDINTISGKAKIMDQYHFSENNYTNQFDGSIDFPRSETDEVVVNFNSGIFNFTTADTDKLSWNCKLDTPPTKDFLNQGDTVEIDLEDFEGANCDIQIPSNLKLTVDGKDAKITVTDSEFDTYIEMKNGQVHFSPNPEVDYNYELKVKNGTMDKFNSIESKDAFEIKIFIENGSILK